MSDREYTRGSDGGRKKKFEMDAWWAERSLPQKVLLVIGFAILGAGLLFLFGWIVMLLWNWLMPDIFGLKRLTYWQAWGLLILSSILFKGIKCGSDESSRRTDRKRRRELRRYMQDEQDGVEGGEDTGGTHSEDEPE